MRQRGQGAVQDQATDADLATRAGAGDLAAFEELYRRHVATAWRVALAVTTNPDDAADAVSDAFTRVFQVLPDRLQAADHFLPYLLAAVRNAAIDILRRQGRQRVTETGEQHDWSVLAAEPAERMVADIDASMVARAFRSLPERWRCVLWLTEVEGIPAREAAGLLGVSANGVAQLAVRARAGLRQRYLQAHLRQAEVRSNCRDTVHRLGAYCAGALPPRDISKVDQHLAGCDTCRSRLAQLEELAATLRRSALPVPATLAALAIGKWRLTSAGTAAGAAGAGTVAPAGIGVGVAAVAAPAAPFLTSVVSVAMFVAGIVGVGVVERQRDLGDPPEAAAAGGGSFTQASTPAEEPAPANSDPVAALVEDGTRAADDVAELAEALAGSLPSELPEVAAPDQAQIDALTRGDVGLDVKAAAISVDTPDGLAACPQVRIMGVTFGCTAAAKAGATVATARQLAEAELADTRAAGGLRR